MEIADIYVINKSDLPGVELLESQLRNLQTMVQSPERPIIRVSAVRDEGVDELVELVITYHPPESNKKIRRLLLSMIREEFTMALERDILLAELAEDLVSGRTNIYAAIDRFMSERGLR